MPDPRGPIDLGTEYGIRGKTDANKDVEDFLGSQLGWNITQVTDRFPDAKYMLSTDLGWSDADILARTYFTMAVLNAGLTGYNQGAGFPFNRNKILYPPGKHWYNSELRVTRAIQEGAGPDNYYGNGATELRRTETGWKSIYGSQNSLVRIGMVPWTYCGEGGMVPYTTTTASFVQPLVGGTVVVSVGVTTNYIVGQSAEIANGGKYIITAKTALTLTLQNNGTPWFDPTLGRVAATAPGATITSGKEVRIITPSPLQNGGDDEWSHGFQVRNICFVGTKTDFNDDTYYETGVLAHNMGENSAVENCLFYYHNDFGVLIRGKTAPFRSYGNSFFHNGVGGYGICGTARAGTELGFSGDFQPWAIYMFRQGEGTPTTAFGVLDGWNTSPNGTKARYWPYYQNSDPGANGTGLTFKLESFACAPTATPDFAGTNPCPIINTAYGKGMRLARLTGRYKFNLWGGSMFVHQGSVENLITHVDDYFSGQGGTPAANSSINIMGLSPIRYKHWLHDTYRNRMWVMNATGTDNDAHGDCFYWNNLTNNGRNHCEGVAWTSVGAAYKGLQPFIPDLFPSLTPAWVNNLNTAPTNGYHPVSGNPF